MKITSSILILLMFAMAFAPCGDASEMSTSQQIKQISEDCITGAANLDCERDKQQGEECSPICPCQCCPSIDSDTIDLSQIAFIAPLARTAEVKYSISSVFNYLIWSPPQLFS